MKSIFFLIPIAYRDIIKAFEDAFANGCFKVDGYNVISRTIGSVEDLHRVWEDAIVDDMRTQAIVIVGDIIAGYLKKSSDDLLSVAQTRDIVVIGIIMGLQELFHPNYFHCSAPSISIQSRVAARFALSYIEGKPEGKIFLAIAVEHEFWNCEYVRTAEGIFKEFLAAYGCEQSPQVLVGRSSIQKHLDNYQGSEEWFFVVGMGTEELHVVLQLLCKDKLAQRKIIVDRSSINIPLKGDILGSISYFDSLSRVDRGKNSYYKSSMTEVLNLINRCSQWRAGQETLRDVLISKHYYQARLMDQPEYVYLISELGQLISPVFLLEGERAANCDVSVLVPKEEAIAELLQATDVQLRYIGEEAVTESLANNKALIDNVLHPLAQKILALVDHGWVALSIFGTTNNDGIFFCEPSANNLSEDIEERLNFFLQKVLSRTIMPIQINLGGAVDDLENNNTVRVFVNDINNNVLPLQLFRKRVAELDIDTIVPNIRQLVFCRTLDGARAICDASDVDDSSSLVYWLESQGSFSVNRDNETDFHAFAESLIKIFDYHNKTEMRALYFLPTQYDNRVKTRRGGDGLKGCLLLLTQQVLKDAWKLSYVNLRILMTVTNRMFDCIFYSLRKYHLRVAYTKSAIGSIMSRNGSHNIGSHVLSALSHNVGTMPDDRVLYQYIQHRMDYIASATTGAPDWSVPTPFVGNLMKMFYSQRHLLDHIAESDGLHAYQYQGKGTQTGAGQKDCVKIVVRKIERYKNGEQPAREKGDGWLRTEREDPEDPRRKIIIDAYEFFSDDPPKQTSKPAGGNQQSKEPETDKKDNKPKTVTWDLDEAVSIPGGILGQHAFYNIVENVLRNAAKHSWAGKSKETKVEAGSNLEIYIDFEKPKDNALLTKKEEGMIRFTVGDNMSKLFHGKFWEAFFKEHPQLAAAFADPLVRFDNMDSSEGKEESEKKDDGVYSSRICLEKYLDGDKDVAEAQLPEHYQTLCNYVKDHWDTWKDNEEFKSLLKGKAPSEFEQQYGQAAQDGPGRRLPVPLHHRQEIALAEPFIDIETNRLRQAAWGLSEMKISAGYLRRAGVAVIGGLNPDVGELPLIVPMGIPRRDKEDGESGNSGGNVGKSKGLSYKDLCLAYRFWVKLPKDVLIVTDQLDKWDGISGEEWEGIGRASYASVFGSGDKTGHNRGDVGVMSDYGFVLVDHAIDKDDQLELPFRALRIADSDEAMSGFPYVSAAELRGKESKNEFLSVVYRAWLNYLKTRRGENAEHPLTIKLNIYEKNGGEKGLISDRDIYRVLFRECLHSVLEPIVSDVNLPAQQRKALLLVSLYPLNEDDPLFEDIEEKEKGSHLLKMKHLLGVLSDRVRRFWSSLQCASEKDCDKWNQLVKAYRLGLERAKKSMEYETIPQALLEELDAFQNHSRLVCDSCMLMELNEMAENQAESSIVKLAAGALEVARTTSDVFLRKYEERIATLPLQYQGVARPKKPILHFNDFDVDIAYGAATPDRPVDISYNRHSTDNAPLYSEPLSGSQTYLNSLSDLSEEDSQWAMRLAENGLLRIVIIDERVRAFIADHGKEIKETYESMRIAVVDTEKPPRFDASGALPDFKDWTYVAGGSGDFNFDLIIIHQGIIDKWWIDHSKKKVADILKKLRIRKDAQKNESQNRFVVVTTGRGRPDNIPENEKVLAFSSIEAFLFKRYPEKLNLVNSLMNILPGSTERSDNND